MIPLVSILIPSYNAEIWLNEAVKSALEQTWTNKEIIVVDDGSTDRSLKVAQQFQSSIVKVISQTNQGASAARNRAYAECRGDFIQYLDADDLLAPHKIELQIHRLQKEEANCIASGAWARFYRSPKEAKFISQPLWQDMLPIDWLVCAWQEHWMMHPSAWLIPRTVAEQAGPWNESLSLNDDGEYFSRIVLASQGIKFCPEAKVYYRSGNPSSLSAKVSEEAHRSNYLAWNLSVQRLLNSENSIRTKSASAAVLQRFIYEAYPKVPALRKLTEQKIHFLGGTNLKPLGGRVFCWLTNLLGWQLAKRFQIFYYWHSHRTTMLYQYVNRIMKGQLSRPTFSTNK